MDGRGDEQDGGAMLSEFIQKAIELGMDGLEIDYKDGQERITAMHGHLGVGIGSVPSGSRESEKLFDEVEALRKSKRVKVNQVAYGATVETYESFGEWAHRIRLTKKAEEAQVHESSSPKGRHRRKPR
jgi:hypothetical protein